MACLSPLARIELSRRLAEDVLFKDDDRFAQQYATVLTAPGITGVSSGLRCSDPAERHFFPEDTDGSRHSGRFALNRMNE